MKVTHSTRTLKYAALAVLTLTAAYAFHSRPAAAPQSTSAATPTPVESVASAPAAPEVGFDTGDIRLGAIDAPVTLIEYASLTCGHCAAFQKDVLPELKKKYIDAGKLLYVYRDFPLDAAAFHASLLSRCVGSQKRPDLVELLMSEQRRWLEGDSIEAVKEHLLPYGRLAGLTDARMQACFDSPILRDAVIASHKTGETEFKVEATPAVFVNAQRVDGGASLEHVSAAIDAALSAAAAKPVPAAVSAVPAAGVPAPAPTAGAPAFSADEDDK